MIYVDSPHPPGTIIMPTGDRGGFTHNWMCLERLIVPKETQLFTPVGMSLASNLNVALRERKGEWVMLMGDDHVFPPNLVTRMLAYNRPVIAPLCAKRRPPFSPLLFDDHHPTDGLWKQIEWADMPPPEKVFEVKGAGMAGMLIREEVWQAVADPWFEIGQIKSDLLTEDLYLQDKIRAKGYTIYVDPTLVIGHLFIACVWPSWRGQDGWGTDIDIGDTKTQTIGLSQPIGAEGVLGPAEEPREPLVVLP